MADDEAAGGGRAPARRGRQATTGSAGEPAKKTVAAKAAPKKTVAKKAAPKKTVAEKAAPRKTVAKKEAAPKKAPARKAPARKAALAGEAAPKKAPAPRKASGSRLAAEQTFDDDWEQPAPVAPPEDPGARIRGLLRAAAASLEGREATAPPPPPPPPPPPAPAPPVEDVEEVEEEDDVEEPVTRVLIAPSADVDEDEGGDWEPPDVIEAEPPPPPPPPPAPSPPPPAAPTVEVQRPPAVAADAGTPTRPRRRGRRVLLSLLVLVVVAAIVVAAVLVIQNRDQGVDYSKLKVGDCFDSSSGNEVRGVKVKSCAKPHDSEIFFLVTHPAAKNAPYPGKDTLVQFAADACLGQPLTAYLGVPLEQSKLKDFEIVPQASSWKDGKRVLVCGLDTGGQGKITGSVKGTRR